MLTDMHRAWQMLLPVELQPQRVFDAYASVLSHVFFFASLSLVMHWGGGGVRLA